MSPRSYEQHRRAESAAQTRQRVVDAAYVRLREAPVERMTVDRVARDAGVSRATVYLVFGDRAGLLDAVGAELLRRSGFEEVMRAIDEPDAHDAVRRFMLATPQMYARNRDVLRSLFSVSQVDPEAAGGAIGRMEAGRRRGMQLLAERLGAVGLLRDGIGLDDAADLLWLVSSFDSFDLLFNGRSRSPEHIAGTLLRAVECTLLRLDASAEASHEGH